MENGTAVLEQKVANLVFVIRAFAITLTLYFGALAFRGFARVLRAHDTFAQMLGGEKLPPFTEAVIGYRMAFGGLPGFGLITGLCLVSMVGAAKLPARIPAFLVVFGVIGLIIHLLVVELAISLPMQKIIQSLSSAT